MVNIKSSQKLSLSHNKIASKLKMVMKNKLRANLWNKTMAWNQKSLKKKKIIDRPFILIQRRICQTLIESIDYNFYKVDGQE